MKSLILILLLLTPFHSFVVNPGEEGASADQKIPSFLGKSYHLLRGNPFTNRVDPGFKSTIFQFTYDQGRTTDDGNYIIADHTYSTDTTSCSLESKVSEFSGTQNYQKELSSVTEVDTRYSYLFVKASFSLSVEFSQFSNSTKSQHRTVTQSNARCEVYTVDMPVFSNEIPLTKSFQEAVKLAAGNGNWRDFLNQFGSHFASRVIFGGRYVYQHEYSAESMSYFASMNIDVKTAAKVQFANAFNLSMSEDLKKYQNQTKLADNRMETTSRVMIGGEPPKSGTWTDWERTVKGNLAPISYDLTALTVLFNFVPDINATKAIDGFNAYLQSYCKTQQCPDINPDGPPPKPLEVTFKKSDEVEAISGGAPFDSFDKDIKVGMRVTRVTVMIYTGAHQYNTILGFEMHLNDGLVEQILSMGYYLQPHSVLEYMVPQNDEIQCIRYGLNTKFGITSYQFVTKKKVESQVYDFKLAPPQYYQTTCLQSSDEHFVGFSGHLSQPGIIPSFYGLSFNIMSETYNP